MERFAVAQARRTHRIAMIRFVQGDEQRALGLSGKLPVLSRHPRRDLHRFGARIGVEDPANPAGTIAINFSASSIAAVLDSPSIVE